MPLRVVFVQYGTGNVDCARMMVASCKAQGYEVMQLSDDKAPAIEGVDSLQRRPMTEGRMLFRARCLCDLQPPYVLLDTDVLVARDIAAGFAGDFDAALTYRARHSVIDKSGEILEMPYNGGVIFVKSQAFMRAVVRAMEAMPAKRQDWYGDQLALRDVADSGEYKVRVLPESEWNYVPGNYDAEAEGMAARVRIFHFKGLRKPSMGAYFRRGGA